MMDVAQPNFISLYKINEGERKATYNSQPDSIDL